MQGSKELQLSSAALISKFMGLNQVSMLLVSNGDDDSNSSRASFRQFCEDTDD